MEQLQKIPRLKILKMIGFELGIYDYEKIDNNKLNKKQFYAKVRNMVINCITEKFNDKLILYASFRVYLNLLHHLGIYCPTQNNFTFIDSLDNNKLLLILMKFQNVDKLLKEVTFKINPLLEYKPDLTFIRINLLYTDIIRSALIKELLSKPLDHIFVIHYAISDNIHILCNNFSF